MTLSHPHVRAQLMDALECFFEIEGRVDRDAQISFDNMTAVFEGPCYEHAVIERSIGQCLYSVEEVTVLKKVCDAYDELCRRAKHGDELACLTNPYYPTFAAQSREAYFLMLRVNEQMGYVKTYDFPFE